MDFLDRRAFLTKLGFLFGSAITAELFDGKSIWADEPGLFAQAGARVSDNFRGSKFDIAPWQGDDFNRGHQLRDATLPEGKIDDHKRVDFVIVGGGVAGLTAAYYLRHHNFLLLEQYSQFGGQSRGSSYGHLNFTYGAAYIGQPEGDVAELFDALALSPAKFDTNRNSWHAGDKCFVGVESSKQDGLYKEFRQFQKQGEPIWQLLTKEKHGTAVADASLQKLDKTLFSTCVSSYSPFFLSMLDSVARSYNCLGLDKISALAGYAILEDLFEPCFAFPGGNTAIPAALVKNLAGSSPERLQKDTFVWSVDVTESGAAVVYSDSAGQVHKVEARHVIVTAPLMVAARIIRNLDNASKAAMLSFRYGSYLVANCLFKRPVFSGGFDNWYGAPFTFADIMIAETVYKKLGEYAADMGQVLTVYQPYVPGSAGRSLLLAGDRKNFSSEILEQLSTISNNLEASLDSIVLSRWGHAMPVTNLGYYSRMSKLASLPYTTFSLAHNSTQGLPCAESAIAAARLAADRALKSKTFAR